MGISELKDESNPADFLNSLTDFSKSIERSDGKDLSGTS